MPVCLHLVLIHSLPYYFSLSFNCLFLSAFLHLLLERDFDEFCRTADGHQYGYAQDTFQYVIARHRISQTYMYLVCLFRGRAGQFATFPYTVAVVVLNPDAV